MFLQTWLNELCPPSFFIKKVGSPAALAGLQRADEMAAQGEFPVLGDLVPAVHVALGLCVCRWFLHRLFLRPLAIRCLKMETVKIECQSKELDEAFRKNKKPSNEEFEEIASQLTDKKWTADEVQHEFWMRRRQASQELRIVKFVEAFWRFLFYAFFTIVGFFTLWYPNPVPWMESPIGESPYRYFDQWPLEPLNRPVQIYYLMELGSYLHQLMWTDVNRSDSVEMMAHHFITLTLIAFSYVFQFMRIGTVIMALHDLPDVFLEAGKCMNYIKSAKGGSWLAPYTDVMFGIFATLFFITRIVIYPLMILRANTVCHAAFGEGNNPSYLFFISLLFALQCLHWFWFFLILRMAYRLLWLNGGVDDIRSDDDEEEEPPAPITNKKTESNSKNNGIARKRKSTRPSSKKEE